MSVQSLMLRAVSCGKFHENVIFWIVRYLNHNYRLGILFLVGALKMNEILRELFLADNRLMPSDGIPLGNMLKINHRLSLLDLRNNHLQVETLKTN